MQQCVSRAAWLPVARECFLSSLRTSSSCQHCRVGLLAVPTFGCAKLRDRITAAPRVQRISAAAQMPHCTRPKPVLLRLGAVQASGVAGPGEEERAAALAAAQRSAEMLNQIVEEVVKELFVEEGTAYVMDSAPELEEAAAIRCAVISRIEFLDAEFLGTVDAFIASCRSANETYLVDLLTKIRAEVIRQVSLRLPPVVQVLNRALEHPTREGRLSVIRTALTNGKGNIPGCDLPVLCNATNQFVTDMEEQQNVVDRRLLARLCLLREELAEVEHEVAFNLNSHMGAGAAPQWNGQTGDENTRSSSSMSGAMSGSYYSGSVEQASVTGASHAQVGATVLNGSNTGTSASSSDHNSSSNNDNSNISGSSNISSTDTNDIVAGPDVNGVTHINLVDGTTQFVPLEPEGGKSGSSTFTRSSRGDIIDANISSRGDSMDIPLSSRGDTTSSSSAAGHAHGGNGGNSRHAGNHRRSTVPQRCAAFLKELVLVKDQVRRVGLLDHAFREDWEGAAPKNSNYKLGTGQDRGSEPDFVRPGRFLTTLTTTRQSLMDAEPGNVSVLQQLDKIHREALMVLDKIQE